MRVAITGSAGFLGVHVAQACLRAGLSVRGLDLAETPIGGVETIMGSVFGAELSSEVFEGVDAVIHLAWSSKPGTANHAFASDADANVVGSVRILEYARQAGVKSVVFASSGGTVYGRSEAQRTREDHVLDPINAYAAGKVAFEAYLHAYAHCHSMRALTLRVSNPYGPGQRGDRPQGLIGAALWRALRGETVTVWGDGEIVRDYVYAADVGEAFAEAVRREALGGVLNIGSGEGLTINQVLDEVDAATGAPLNRRYEAGRCIDVARNVLDISAAADQLGWRPRTDFATGLKNHYEWAKGAVS